MKPEEVADLVKYRMEQARNARDDAQYLFDGSRTPQSVINRSYYAMFYAVLALLQQTGKMSAKHANIFPREMSKSFHRAFELRQASDYRVKEPATLEKAGELLIKTGRFVKAVGEYLKIPG
jgi:uncharacterized protein (UPF0332 family)